MRISDGLDTHHIAATIPCRSGDWQNTRIMSFRFVPPILRCDNKFENSADDWFIERLALLFLQMVRSETFPIFSIRLSRENIYAREVLECVGAHCAWYFSQIHGPLIDSRALFFGRDMISFHGPANVWSETITSFCRKKDKNQRCWRARPRANRRNGADTFSMDGMPYFNANAGQGTQKAKQNDVHI